MDGDGIDTACYTIGRLDRLFVNAMRYDCVCVYAEKVALSSCKKFTMNASPIHSLTPYTDQSISCGCATEPFKV